MRIRKTWGILGSFAGIAGSMAVLAYSAIALMAMTSPAVASPPDCIAEQFAVVDAEVNASVDQGIYTQRVYELVMCQMGGGSCITEQFNATDAYVNYVTSLQILQAKQWALMQCQSQF